jgi:N-acetylglucosamine kinase
VPELVALLDRAVRVRLLRQTDQPLLVPGALTVDPGLIGAAMLGFQGLQGGGAGDV